MGSADIYRPAAIAQLETLAAEVGVDFFPSAVDQKPADIARQLIKHAEQQFYDVVILDTAGRWHVDAEMMSEIKALHQQINPTETLFVVDSMTGQEAANTAKSFDEALDLTGIILTKVDGDARGGAALSIRHVTGKPIKFLGVGEKTTALEPFHPERIASRILGMGDILSLIEAAEQKVDQKKAAKLAKKMKQGDGFDLEDFRDQIKQMTAMGGVNSLLDKLPGAGKLPQTAHNKFNDQQFGKMEAIINSMTVQERRFPANIRGSQKRRIAAGSGTQIPDVNRLLKQFEQMQKTMKKMGRKGNVKKMMRNLESANLFPPGMGL